MRFREMLADVSTQEKQFLTPKTKSKLYKVSSWHKQAIITVNHATAAHVSVVNIQTSFLSLKKDYMPQVLASKFLYKRSNCLHLKQNQNFITYLAHIRIIITVKHVTAADVSVENV